MEMLVLPEGRSLSTHTEGGVPMEEVLFQERIPPRSTEVVHILLGRLPKVWLLLVSLAVALCRYAFTHSFVDTIQFILVYVMEPGCGISFLHVIGKVS